MAKARYLAVSAIAKQLDLPESTLHYWKNRFSDHLPSRGEGRARRFTPEAVEVFRTIARLLEAGLSVEDVRAELGRGETAPPSDTGRETPAPAGPGQDDLAQRLGTLLARAVRLAAGPDGAGASPEAQPAPGRPGTDLNARLAAAETALADLAARHRILEGKLGVLEAELIRLRKEGREREKDLMEKIRGLRGA